MSVGMAVVADSQSEHLLDKEADAMSIELAVLVVDLNGTNGKLVGQELVLLENTVH